MDSHTSDGLRFNISFPRSVSTQPQAGRLILIIANNNKEEPRFQFRIYSAHTQLGFGRDVEELQPGEVVIMDGSTFGFPIRNLNEIPAGDYWVQVVLNRYETFHRADGFTVKLPPDKGEGQHWQIKPGNLYSQVKQIHIEPNHGQVVNVTLDQVIPPVPEPHSSHWVRYMKIQSPLLTKFWGRPMYIGAYVLLPDGFENHPNAHYPLAIIQDHFREGFPEFRTSPPAPGMTDSERSQARYAYEFFRKWTSPDFPRMLVVRIIHPNPFYDDSYAVNSANIGPYGDAIVEELIPEIEKRFRGIGQGWSRVMMGGSTGGWEALADQIFYPDYFNGVWAFCPDPVDFRQYETINIYEHANAYFTESDWKHTPRPSGTRNWGNPIVTVQEDMYWEHVLGTRGRSGQQWAAWQAVYSPVGPDGYPAEIWDPITGEINHDVARYWKENYDFRYILERDWKTIGPKLTGKIHIYVGTLDTWHLDNAVHLLQDFLDSTRDPYYAGHIEFGEGYDHSPCWTGYYYPDEQNRSTVLGHYIPIMAEHIRNTAPKGADMSWVY